MTRAFTWGVLRFGVVQPGMTEADAREAAAERGQVVRVAYSFPNGQVSA